jgi:hypothetical protein
MSDEAALEREIQAARRADEKAKLQAAELQTKLDSLEKGTLKYLEASKELAESNVKAGLASGLITGLSGGLSKIPGVNTAGKNLVRKGVKAVQTLAPGYSSDVVSGLAGMRGEDRTGGKAFIPGVGTALVGGIAGIPLAKKAVSNVADDASSYLYKKAITPNVQDAERIFRSKVNTPLSKKFENSLTYGQNIT